MHTPRDKSDSLLIDFFLTPMRASTDIAPPRSGYEAAEYRQNGADVPNFSLLNAIYS